MMERRGQAVTAVLHGEPDIIIDKLRHGLIGPTELALLGQFMRSSNLGQAWQGEQGGLLGVPSRMITETPAQQSTFQRSCTRGISRVRLLSCGNPTL